MRFNGSYETRHHIPDSDISETKLCRTRGDTTNCLDGVDIMPTDAYYRDSRNDTEQRQDIPIANQ